MKCLTLEQITAEAFAPFGLVLPPPALGSAPLKLFAELQNLRPSAGPRLSFVTVAAKELPLEAVEMERHVYSSQTFVPIDCASYLVLVALHGPEGLPDMATLRAFQVPGDTGINYKASTWHYPLAALERTARFTILTFIDGTATDEQFEPLSETALISA
jgi:ureidoglycolate lyase